MKKSLFGYGKTTKALSCSGGWDIYDDGFIGVNEDNYGNFLLEPSLFEPSVSSLEIPSPGFPPTHTLIKNALHVKSEYDYFSHIMPYSIWITGTNGKTTTTQMTTHLLADKGAVSGGNIGTPLAELPHSAPFWVLETSSFTLHYTNEARPNIYVILPIKPDHISWHGSFEEYESAKLKPLESMSEGSVVIMPKAYKNHHTKAYKITYENSEDLANIIGAKLDQIKIKEPFLMDAMLALCVEYVLFGKCDTEKINNFVLDPHKLQELHDKKGRLWVNDTKGTNLDATIEAVKRYQDKHICIILGGDDKGVELDRLFEMMAPLHVEVFAIGSNANKLMDLSQRFNIKATKCDELKIAVHKIDEILRENGVGLLSPAAASLDQFSSYLERGEVFMEEVSKIS